MKKLNISLIAGICFMVLILLIVGVFSYHFVSTSRQAASVKKTQDYPLPNVKANGTKPSTSLNTAAGSVVITPTPETFTASLTTQLNSTIDDGGQSDIDAIKAAADKL
jgi:hypothetical protein